MSNSYSDASRSAWPRGAPPPETLFVTLRPYRRGGPPALGPLPCPAAPQPQYPPPRRYNPYSQRRRPRTGLAISPSSVSRPICPHLD